MAIAIEIIILLIILVAMLILFFIIYRRLDKINFLLFDYKSQKTNVAVGQKFGGHNEEDNTGRKIDAILDTLERYYNRPKSDSPIQEQGEHTDDDTTGNRVVKNQVTRILKRIEYVYNLPWPKYPSGEKKEVTLNAILDTFESYYSVSKSDSPIQEQGERTDDDTTGNRVVKNRIAKIIRKIENVYNINSLKSTNEKKKNN